MASKRKGVARPLFKAERVADAPVPEMSGLYEGGLYYMVPEPGTLRVYGDYSALADTKMRVSKVVSTDGFVEHSIDVKGIGRVGPFIVQPRGDGAWELLRHEKPTEKIRLTVQRNHRWTEDSAPTARQRIALQRRTADLNASCMPGRVDARPEDHYAFRLLRGSQFTRIKCDDCSVEGDRLEVCGDRNVVRGNWNIVNGDDNYVLGDNSSVCGFGTVAFGVNVSPSTTRCRGLASGNHIHRALMALRTTVQKISEAALAREEKHQRDLEMAMSKEKRFKIDFGQQPRDLCPPAPETATAALTCSVCIEYVCDQVLSCGHLLCTRCLLSLVRSDSGSVSCPKCRSAVEHSLRLFV